jgi:pantetheine-phosphate adenylyltransferase
MPKKKYMSLRRKKRFIEETLDEPKVSVITHEGLTTELCKN